MIWQLIRQDPAFRRLPFWCVMAALWATMSVGIVAYSAVKGQPIGPGYLATLWWLAVVVFLAFGEVNVRADHFSLALPIPVRRLWLAHLAAVGLSGFAILLVSGTMIAVSVVLIGRVEQAVGAVGSGFGNTGHAVAIGALLVAGLFPAVVAVHAFRPHVQAVPRSTGHFVWTLAVGAGTLALSLALRPLGVFGALVLLAVGALGLWRLLRSFPDMMSIASERQESTPVAGTSHITSTDWQTTALSPLRHMWLTVRTVHGVTTCAKKQIAIWIIVPFLLFLGFWVSGLDPRWVDTSQRFAYPFMIVYVLLAASLAIGGLGALDWTPWSRRRLLAAMIVPLFLAVAAGYGLGRIADVIVSARYADDERIHLIHDRDTNHYYTRVPCTACRISWDGSLPEISSPWGETIAPWSKPVVRGLPMRMYSPYHTPPGSSIDFVALQLSRAVEAVYGTHIPPDELRARYLEARADGTAALRGDALTLQRDYPELTLARGGVYFPPIMAMVIAMWSVLTAIHLRWHRPGVSERRRKVVGWIAVAIPMLCWILDFVLTATEVSEIPMRHGFITNLARDAAQTPQGVAAVWIGSAILAWGAYRLAERRLERAELSGTTPGRCT